MKIESKFLLVSILAVLTVTSIAAAAAAHKQIIKLFDFDLIVNYFNRYDISFCGYYDRLLLSLKLVTSAKPTTISKNYIIILKP